MKENTFIVVFLEGASTSQMPWLTGYKTRQLGKLDDKVIVIGRGAKLPKINPTSAFMLSTDSKFQSFKRTGDESLGAAFNVNVEIYPLFEIATDDHEELSEREDEYDSAIETFKRECGLERLSEAYGHFDEWLCLPEGTRVVGTLDSFYQAVKDLEKNISSDNDYVLSYVDSAGKLRKSGERESSSELAPSVGLFAAWPAPSGNGLLTELLLNRTGVFLEQTSPAATQKQGGESTVATNPAPITATSVADGVELTIVEAHICAPTPQHAFGVAKLSGWVRNTTAETRQVALRCAVLTTEGTMIGLKNLQSRLDSDSECNEVFPKYFNVVPAASKLEFSIEFDVDLLEDPDKPELRLELLAAYYGPVHSDVVRPQKQRLFKATLQEDSQLVLHRRDLSIAEAIVKPPLLRMAAVNDDCQLPVRWSIEVHNPSATEMVVGTKVSLSNRRDGFYSDNEDLRLLSSGETRTFMDGTYIVEDDINKEFYFEWPLELWQALGRVSCTCTTRIVHRLAKPLER